MCACVCACVRVCVCVCVCVCLRGFAYACQCTSLDEPIGTSLAKSNFRHSIGGGFHGVRIDRWHVSATRKS